MAVVAASWENPALLGWARVAALLAEPDGPVSELVVAAPVIGASMHDLALSTPALAPALSLVALPSLAESPDEPYVQNVFGASADTRTVLDRVVRVIEGAAALTGVGAVRPVSGGFVLYLRGVRVLGLVSEREAVSVTFLEPERRHVHISESNFPRWGVDIHEQVVQLAQDPRLLEHPEVERDGLIEGIAEEARVHVTAHWLPWNREGTDPIAWVGIDADRRPVLGLVRPSVGLATVGPVTAALALLAREREVWVPGSAGRARVLISSTEYDPRFEEALAVFDADVERAGEPSEVAAPRDVSDRDVSDRDVSDREPRGRRRPRRRRRGGRGDPARPTGVGSRAQQSRSEDREQERSPEPVPDDPDLPTARPDHSFEASSEEGDEAPSYESRSREPQAVVEDQSPAAFEPVAEPVAEPVTEPSPPSSNGADVEEEVSGPEPVGPQETDVEDDTLAAVRGEEADPEQVLERTPPPPRRPRAAIVVRNDFDSILAALVLARERRNVVLFWVCRQDELMDFFKGKATDLSESVDILLVGFTAQPVPKEVLITAEVYRGRILWFDHHSWPIEDLELLREVVGRDAIVIVEGAASPLAAVMEVAERRSRFTDKLVDFAGRRLSENDMEKWGYALAALLRRLAESSGDYRADIVPVLTGKPASLPEAGSVYSDEESWLAEHDPRVVHFGEYKMSVVHVPEQLDSGEVARRARLRAGTRLSLASREGDETVLLVANEEKRHINVQGLADYLAGRLSWVEPRPSGDRAARLLIEDLPRHPERLELLVSEIARHKSVLYG